MFKHTHRIGTYLAVAAAALVLAGALARDGRADFVLEGTQHMDVTTSHALGVLWNSSTADILSGGYIYDAYVSDMARLRVLGPSGPVIYKAWLYNSAQIAVSSGWMVSIYAYERSAVDISGGQIGFILYAYDSSAVNISGGSVVYLDAYETSAADISGGSVNWLNAWESSTVDISGGSVDHVSACHNAAVDISGGSVSSLYAYGGSITLHGCDFQATGGLTLDGDRVLGMGVLTGRWSGSDEPMWALNISENKSTATIRAIVVPEPATLALLALGGLGLVGRARRAKH